MRQVKKN